jgi:hypothetical protein
LANAQKAFYKWHTFFASKRSSALLNYLIMTDRRNDDQKGQPTDNSADQNSNDALRGRVNNTANPLYQEKEEEADISHIDQQEGTMNNGVLGGNMEEDKE